MLVELTNSAESHIGEAAVAYELERRDLGFRFEEEVRIGDRLSIQDAAGYTMVKKNWFNGVKMPAIAVRQLDGAVDVVKEFTYDNYMQSLS